MEILTDNSSRRLVLQKTAMPNCLLRIYISQPLRMKFFRISSCLDNFCKMNITLSVGQFIRNRNVKGFSKLGQKFK